MPDSIRNALNAQGNALADLYRRADAQRKQIHGDAVHLRGIIEFSNHCANQCLYCGIRMGNPHLMRYCMNEDEILAAAHHIEDATPCKTVVLQGGETPGYNDDDIARLIRRIASETALAITLSIGNRPRDVYARWQDAGLHRYLLRFETASPDLFHRIHPDCRFDDRLRCLRDIRELGLQTGSGFMIGIPGETRDTLVENLMFCKEFDFDMVGIGPFIPATDTPMGGTQNVYAGDVEMPFRAYALLRLLLPNAHIPATTALDTFQPGGRWKALAVGANVYMPNMTPFPYRSAYQLYPDKPGIHQTPDDTMRQVLDHLQTMGRPPSTDAGEAKRLCVDSKYP